MDCSRKECPTVAFRIKRPANRLPFCNVVELVTRSIGYSGTMGSEKFALDACVA